jgi:hypothetical protein
MGLAKLILLGEVPFDRERVLRFARSSPFFVSTLQALISSRLPNGPEMVFVGHGQRLGETTYSASDGRARMFVVPEGQRAPTGHLLRDVFGGRALTLDELHARVSE